MSEEWMKWFMGIQSFERYGEVHPDIRIILTALDTFYDDIANGRDRTLVRKSLNTIYAQLLDMYEESIS